MPWLERGNLQNRYLFMTNQTIYNSIFKSSENRKTEQNENYISYKSEIEGKISFIEIELFKNSIYEIENNSDEIFIIPIIGSCIIKNSTIEDVLVNSEELMVIKNSILNRKITIQNSQNDSIKFILIYSISNLLSLYQNSQNLFKIEIKEKNKWSKIDNLDFMKIGVFDSRTKDVIKLNTETNAFICSINGCFEVENRLLNQNDLLYLKNSKQIEFEALSEFAILLFIEHSYNN